MNPRLGGRGHMVTFDRDGEFSPVGDQTIIDVCYADGTIAKGAWVQLDYAATIAAAKANYALPAVDDASTTDDDPLTWGVALDAGVAGDTIRVLRRGFILDAEGNTHLGIGVGAVGCKVSGVAAAGTGLQYGGATGSAGDAIAAGIADRQIGVVLVAASGGTSTGVYVNCV